MIGAKDKYWQWRSEPLPEMDGKPRWLLVCLGCGGTRLQAYVNAAHCRDTPTATAEACAMDWPEPWLTVLQLVDGWGGQSLHADKCPLPAEIAGPTEQYVTGAVSVDEYARLLSGE